MSHSQQMHMSGSHRGTNLQTTEITFTHTNVFGFGLWRSISIKELHLPQLGWGLKNVLGQKMHSYNVRFPDSFKSPHIILDRVEKCKETFMAHSRISPNLLQNHQKWFVIILERAGNSGV